MSEFLHDNLAGNGQHNDYEPQMAGGQILPPPLQNFLLNRFFEIIGIIIMAVVLFAVVSLLSWSPTDPSLNHATSDIAQNRMGLTGAYTSDFLIQTFGMALVFLFVPILIMGINLTRHKQIKRPILRSIAWVFSALFMAGALSALPTFGGWPLKVGLGGIAGDVTISIIADLFGSSLHIMARTAAAVLLAVSGSALGLYACGLRFKEMLAKLTFMNEASIDSGAKMVKSARQTTSQLGLKSLSLANHISSLKNRNKDPFRPDKKPWKVPDDNAPLEYEDLTEKNTEFAARNENDMKNTPNFLSPKNQVEPDMNGSRSEKYNPLKAKTNQFISKILSGLAGQKNDGYVESDSQSVEPSFNPHAFEPIQAPRHAAVAEPHIPNLNQEVQAHYQQQQDDTYNINHNEQPQFQAAPVAQAEMIHSEVVGSAEMGDFYDGPNGYEDYWTDSVVVQDAAMPAAPIVASSTVAAPIPDIHPFAPQATPETHYQTPIQQVQAPVAPIVPAYNDAPAYDESAFYDDAAFYNQQFEQAIPAVPIHAQPISAPIPATPISAAPAAVAPAAITPIVTAPAHIAAAQQIAPIAVAPAVPNQAIAPMPSIDIEPAEPSSNLASQPFDLSSPQVDVRKGRVVNKEAATGFRHGPPTAENYELPSVDLLAMPVESETNNQISEKILAANARILENVLAEFRISGEIMNVRPGPVVTLYELEPAPGVKSARVIGLADDIARSMSAISARIAVIPGRNVIGIELPNEHRDTVYLNEIISSNEFKSNKMKLPMALGKSIDGTPVVTDLARMPHLLIAGTTGSGKSVGINSMILSILYKMPPDKCKLIMIDPKMLELSIYDGIPHLLTPVVTDPKKAVVALKWSVREMENRYKKMSKLGVRNIEGYNQRIKTAEDKGEPLMRTVQTGFDHETGQPVYEHEELDYKEMPFIVIVIDEMADLMMVAGKEIEGVIQRLAQMARAAGIHMITATQRPSVDVITGSIKANFPTRISFQVTSKIDSRTILNEMGAEQLLGQGDMLHMAGGGRINRVHGAFVADEEVESVVNHLKRQGVPEYIDDITTDIEPEGETAAPDGGPAPTTDSDGNELELYDQAVAIVARDKKASTSYIQRKLSIGYNRAATIIERMEDEGVIGPANHAGKRDILVGSHDEI